MEIILRLVLTILLTSTIYSNVRPEESHLVRANKLLELLVASLIIVYH